MGTVTTETVSETVVSNPNGSQRSSELTDKPKRRRERKKKKSEKQGNALKNNDCHITNRKDITEYVASQEEKRTEEAEKTTKEDQVYPIENILSDSTLLGESCQQTCVCPHEEPGAAQIHINPILSARDDLQPDANMACSKSNKRRRKRGKKEKQNALRNNGVDVLTSIAGVASKCDAMHISGAEGSKLMNTAEQSAVSAGDDALVQIVKIDVKAEATVSKIPKKKKRKRTKPKEVCQPSGNTLGATKDSGLVQSLLECSEGEGTGNNGRNTDQNSACKELTSKMESSAASVKSGVQNLGRTNAENGTGEKTVVDQDVSGAEGISNLGGKKGKKKKRGKKKKSADQETANVESKEEVEVKTIGESICGNSSVKDEEREVDSSLSSYVVGQDNVAQGVVSGEIGQSLPRCTCLGGDCSKKLLVLDLNGILADIVQRYNGKLIPDGKISGRAVFRRPFLGSFLEFCFERFDVGIWSSRRIGLSTMINIVMRNHANRLLFHMDAELCTQTMYKTLENEEKPLVLKDLRRVWDRFGTCHSCGKRKYDESNTLLVDDSPYKALCNPPHTGIFPHTYQHTDHDDSTLAPNGDLRVYLERLADAENVQKFVEEHPYGEPAISESHPSWGFYSKVIQGHNRIELEPESP